MEHGRTALLYLDDSYLRVFSAEVVEVSGDAVVLDRTAFHPRGGGLVSDVGFLRFGDVVSRVVEAFFTDGGVAHRLEGGLPRVGEVVEGEVDWEKRYRIMRMHTGLHVLAATMVEKTGALITGNNISYDGGRVDFSLEAFDRGVIEEVVEETNRRLAVDHPVRVYYLEREKVLSMPGMVKLANRLPPDVPVLRIVEIEGLDVQADGGPHVRNTVEVGRIMVVKLENKGKANRRLYFTVSP
ncbi:MAG: alanyl-tRNA editing protein [Candidatus Caldarchaeum sp.]|uniref:Alanyl-tRNA editing protein n=1 Tax=Caldiarchaeum subterraneum TaxID=311458 RepID=A0A7C4E141_CALS0|nr:alanyl-tRNA editing protein [Candidatus Caldarchaeales archaeon]